MIIMKSNNKFPKLSIVTVSYNCRQEIEDTILSVINQDYPDIEYIIIDGGSTDGTVDIIKKYSDKLAYWVSEPDKGLYDAMNKGILKATGEWVTLRNCGDYFAEKNSLSKLFADDVDPTVDFICAGAYRVTPLGYYLSMPKPISKDRIKMTIVHPATFVRTEWHKNNLFDTRYKVSADYNLIYNSIKSGKNFVYKNIPIVVFPEGGYSSVHWKTGKREGRIIRGQYNSNVDCIITELWILRMSITFKIKKILTKIPMIKKMRDNKLITAKNIKPLPIPLENFY